MHLIRTIRAEHVFEQHANAKKDPQLITASKFVQKYINSNCCTSSDRFVHYIYSSPPEYYLIPQDNENKCVSNYDVINKLLITRLYRYHKYNDDYNGLKTFGRCVSSSNPNLLVSFHSLQNRSKVSNDDDIFDNFQYDEMIENVTNFLNENLKGKWIKCELNDEKVKDEINNDFVLNNVSIYKFKSIKNFDSCFKKCVENRIAKNVSISYQPLSNKTYLKNKWEDKNKQSNHWISVVCAKWKFQDKINVNKCIIIQFMNCQNDKRNKLPLDYRCIRCLYSSSYNSYAIKPMKYWYLFYDIYDESRITTPRLAFKFFLKGSWMLQQMIHEPLTWWFKYYEMLHFEFMLFHLSKPLFQRGLIDSLYRILLRFCNGLCVYSFECNSTSEQFIIHLITNMLIEEAAAGSSLKSKFAKIFASLPVYGKKDNDIDHMINSGLIDHDVTLLFNNKNIHSKTDENNVCYRFLDLHNLHPSKWFVPFDYDKINDYKLDIPLNQASIWAKLFEDIERLLHKSQIKQLKHWNIKQIFKFVNLKNIKHVLMLQFNPNTLDERLLSHSEVSHDEMDKHWLSNPNLFSIQITSTLDTVLCIRRLYRFEIFIYLQKQYDIFNVVLKAYYYDLMFEFIHKLSTNQDIQIIQCELQTYLFILSIMTRKIMNLSHIDVCEHPQDINAKKTECNEYFRNCLKNIVSNDTFIAKLSNLKLDKICMEHIYVILCYLRAPILFMLNYKIRKKTCKFMMEMYWWVIQNIKCGNKNCKKTNHTKLKICKGCMSKRYCSKQCQKSDWLNHKSLCSA